MEKRKSKKQISFVHGVSGFFASMLATSMFFPLQTIQIHLEAVKNPRLKSICKLKDASSFVQTQEIVKQLGFKGLYNGISFYIIGCALSNSVYFYSEQFIKESLKLTNFKVWKQAEIQFLAAICNIFITAPIWTVNTKMNLSQGNQTFLQTFHSMVKNQGFLSLYNGVPASLFLTINPMVSNTLYHTIQEKSKIKIPTLAAGAISKTVATLITFPYLVIRTNLQVINKNKQQSKSTFDVVNEIYKEKGMNGFFAGQSCQILSKKLGMKIKFIETVLNQAFLLFFHDKLTKQFKKVLYKENY